jgi:hypothetical protein
MKKKLRIRKTMELTVICGAGLRLATVDEMVNQFYEPWGVEQIFAARQIQMLTSKNCSFIKDEKKEKERK